MEVLNDLMKKRDEQRTKKILKAITSSEHTYDEILDFIKSRASKE